MTNVLIHRIILTVILVSTLGKCDTEQKVGENLDSSTSSSSEDKSSRALPFYRRNSYAYYSRPSTQDDSRGSSNFDRDRDYERPPTDASPPADIISSTSYSIRPDSASGTNVNVNTKPLSLVISSADKYTSRDPGYRERPRYEFPKLATQSYRNQWESQAQAGYDPMSYKCLNGQNCDAGAEDDAFKSYYAVLNGDSHKQVSRNPSRPDHRRYDYDDRKDSDIMLSDTYRATFPFTVRGVGPQKDKLFPEDSDFLGLPKPRPTRTSTTNSPKWVRLQPLSNRDPVYDPFPKLEKTGRPGSSSSSLTSTKPDQQMDSSKYANRLGVEISPESFAERWGYSHSGHHSHHHSHQKGTGSRIPSWLEDVNNNQNTNINNNYGWSNEQSVQTDGRRPVYGAAYSGPTRDEDPKNWVKLEPIPVAGVSISKWVPKGTHSGDLPSTGNYIRDRPSAWWDRHDQKRPEFNKPMMGWGSSASTTSLPTTTNFPIIQHHQVKKPTGETTSWNDIIYPDDPLSATGSWESTTLNGVSKFPGTSIKMGWKADNSARRPVATWSASGSGTKSYNNHRFNIRRPGNPTYYPDIQGSDDDPRWVLVSNSKRVSNYGHGHHFSDRHRYRPNLDRFRDDLNFSDDDSQYDEYALQLNTHRVAKDYKASAEQSSNDIFMRLNATLSQLEPVLNHKNTTEKSKTPGKVRLETTESSEMTETTTPKSRISTTTRRSFLSPLKGSFLSSLLGTSRDHQEKPPRVGYPDPYPPPPPPPYPTPPPTPSTTVAPARRPNNTTTTITIEDNRPSLRPILAAVGAGMIPATMAAVLHGVMGKRRKRSFPQVPEYQFAMLSSRHPQYPYGNSNQMYPEVLRGKLLATENYLQPHHQPLFSTRNHVILSKGSIQEWRRKSSPARR